MYEYCPYKNMWILQLLLKLVAVQFSIISIFIYLIDLPRSCICASLLLMATSCPCKVEAAEKTSMFDSLLMQ